MEDYRDQALFLLGKECYATPVPDPALAALYPKLEEVQERSGPKEQAATAAGTRGICLSGHVW